MNKPIPGSIVHFVTERGQHRPAIVISVKDPPPILIKARESQELSEELKPGTVVEMEPGETIDFKWRYTCELQVFFSRGVPGDLHQNPLYRACLGYLSGVEQEQPAGIDDCMDRDLCRCTPGTWHWPTTPAAPAESEASRIRRELDQKIPSGAAKPESATGAQTAQPGPRTTGGKNGPK